MDIPAQSLPYTREAEEAVIGGLIIDPAKWDVVSEVVVATDFFLPTNVVLYKAIQSLVESQSPVDVITVAESLSESDYVAVGGMTHISELASNVVTTSNIEKYAELVREHARERQFILTAHHMLSDSSPLEQRIDSAESALMLLKEGGRPEGPVGMSALLSETMDHISMLVDSGGGLTGLTTGFADIDDATSGLQNGDMVVVAGRPSMGKTAFMMNMAEAAVLSNAGAVVVFSLEMPRKQLVSRLLSGLGRVPFEHIRNGSLSQDELDRIAAAVSVLHNRKLEIDDDGGITAGSMRTRLKQIQRKHGRIAMVVVDYLQLMSGGGKNDNRNQQITDISRKMKLLAKEFDCPVVVGSQLNRSLEQRMDKRPVMSDLRESGAIEQDADVIFALYRDEVYNPTSPDKGIGEVLILKQRNGPIGRKRLLFRGEYVRYENLVLRERYSAYEGEY